MKNQIGEELTLDDDNRYVIADDFFVNNKEYLYLVNEDDTNDVSLVSFLNDTIHAISDDNEFNIVYEELINRNKEDIIDIIEEATTE